MKHEGIALKYYDRDNEDVGEVVGEIMRFLDGLPISVGVDPNRACGSVERLHIVPGDVKGHYVLAPCFGNVLYDGVDDIGSDYSVEKICETGRVGFRVGKVDGIEVEFLATRKNVA